MPAFTEDLSGKIYFESPQTGDLYIFIADEEAFKIPFSGIDRLIIPVGCGELEAGSIEFSLESIPRGTYCIRCYLDTNGDGKLNRGITGPSEPWGMSFKSERNRGIPQFDDVSFCLYDDKHDINIILR